MLYHKLGEHRAKPIQNKVLLLLLLLYHRRSPTPGTITIHASLTEPHQGATKQKR